MVMTLDVCPMTMGNNRLIWKKKKKMSDSPGPLLEVFLTS